jgi:hypothetical protein
MNAFMNPFILLCGILLYPGLLDTDEVTAQETIAEVEPGEARG